MNGIDRAVTSIWRNTVILLRLENVTEMLLVGLEWFEWAVGARSGCSAPDGWVKDQVVIDVTGLEKKAWREEFILPVVPCGKDVRMVLFHWNRDDGKTGGFVSNALGKGMVRCPLE